VRQASFKGIREDKPAAEVRREEPKVVPRGGREASHTAPVEVAAKVVGKKAAGQKTKAPVKVSEASDISAHVRLTHPQKILDAESQLTKQQLAEYYWAVAPHMLPYIEGRPLSLVRCPEGTGKPCFYQKHVNQMAPPGIESVDVPDKAGKIEPYFTLSTAEALAGLAQMGVLEAHPWGSRNDDLEHPDRIIFDLDPDLSISWARLAESADEVRKRLKKLGLESFLKSTGGKGLHVVAPIAPEHGWPIIKEFAHAVVLQMERENPALYLTKMTKAARKDRIYLDYLRNERGATAVAAFSPRARVGAPVSLPLSWSELKSAKRPTAHVADFEEWKGRLKRDPWKQFFRVRQRITSKLLGSLKISPSK
jgi:bifunctional non-homologous end joining protein LigD